MPKSTANLKGRMIDRYKLVFGHSVTIGNVYSGVILINGNEKEIKKPLQALSFENGRLLLSSVDRRYFAFVSGDIAAYRKKIIAECFVTSINFARPVTEETNAMTLKDKYHFVPPRLIDAIVKGAAVATP